MFFFFSFLFFSKWWRLGTLSWRYDTISFFTPTKKNTVFFLFIVVHLKKGAIYMENASNINMTNNIFNYLDGNVIIMYGYNRNNYVYRNTFEYIGDNVIGGWGITDYYNGSNGLQPRFISILENYVHDIGLFQMQSSLWFQAKSCQNTIKNNIGFNLPRAGILFNDNFGGGTNVSNNLLFNTCTESGDHGNINSWNRIPYLTDVVYGLNKLSFDSLYNNIYNNFLIANFNAGWGMDTDDGTAYFNIFNNFFHQSLGLKNDYGGYFMNYFNNINIITDSYYNCWNFGSVKYYGPGDIVYDNKCITYYNPGNNQTLMIVDMWYPDGYNNKSIYLYNNSYYTYNSQASFLIGNSDGFGYLYSLQQIQNQFSIDLKSSLNNLPQNQQVVQWITQLLNI